jgi:hypothetical protein
MWTIFEDIKENCILLHSVFHVFSTAVTINADYFCKETKSGLCNVEDCVLCEVRMKFRMIIKRKSVFKGSVSSYSTK